MVLQFQQDLLKYFLYSFDILRYLQMLGLINEYPNIKKVRFR